MIQATLKCIALVLLLLFWFPLVWSAKRLGKLEFRDKCMMSCASCILYVMEMRVHVKGELADDRPLLMVSNHLSYMDVPVISAIAPVRFSPKAEIAGWPVISSVCKATDCVFVDRRVGKIKDASAQFVAALEKGEVLSLFPESTTGNGLHVLPFKSSFLSLAEKPVQGKELWVQPVALTFLRVRKLPVDSTMWPKLAWVGDALLAPHFWEFLQLGRTDVALVFLPPVRLSQFGDRKALAAYCQDTIMDAINEAKRAPIHRTVSRFARFKAIWRRSPQPGAYAKAKHYDPPQSRG